MSKDLELAIQAAREAGALIGENYRKTKTVSKKGVNDFVTQTDRQAEEIIIARLGQTPYAILGEESGETKTKSSKKWVIDPIGKAYPGKTKIRIY